MLHMGKGKCQKQAGVQDIITSGKPARFKCGDVARKLSKIFSHFFKTTVPLKRMHGTE